MDDAELMANANTAAILSEALNLRADEALRNLFLGAGLVGFDPYREPYGKRKPSMLLPTLAVDSKRANLGFEGALPITELTGLRDALVTVLGGALELQKDVMVISVRQGYRHSPPGAKIRATGSGRIGPHVRWQSTRSGFLTAGHVAQTVGAQVTDDAGMPLGTVVWSNDPATAQRGSADVDVALVAFDPAFTAATGHSLATGHSGQSVKVVASGKTSNILGYWGHIQLGSTANIYSDCYATDNKITIPGDSGGLVTDRATNVLGMVVGGFIQRDMSIIQSASYQLSEIRHRSGHILSI